MACVPLLCDTWAAVGGPWHVFIQQSNRNTISLQWNKAKTSFVHRGHWAFGFQWSAKNADPVYPILAISLFSLHFHTVHFFFFYGCSLIKPKSKFFFKAVWITYKNARGERRESSRPRKGWCRLVQNKLYLTFPFDNHLKTINFNTGLNVYIQLRQIWHAHRLSLANWLNLSVLALVWAGWTNDCPICFRIQKTQCMDVSHVVTNKRFSLDTQLVLKLWQVFWKGFLNTRGFCRL